jgi:hypothetical protein
MKTSLKVMMAAISIATLASPVMAQSLITRPDVGDVSNAHAPVADSHRERTERAAPILERNQIHIDDAVPFSRQSGR